jgi:hypothetical protein
VFGHLTNDVWSSGYAYVVSLIVEVHDAVLLTLILPAVHRQTARPGRNATIFRVRQPYVDLNQVKAGRAPSLEESDCSAIHDRLRAWRRREAEASVEKFRAGAPDGYELETGQMEELFADCFLAPIDDQGPLMAWDGWGTGRPTKAANSIPGPDDSSTPKGADPSEAFKEEKQEKEESSVPGRDSKDSLESSAARENAANAGEPESMDAKPAGRPQATRTIHPRLQSGRRRRASDNVFLSMPPEQYLQIVQWTIQQLPSEKCHPMPREIEVILRRWSVEPSCWRAVVEHFGDWFHHAVGRAASLACHLEHAGKRWIQGIRYCRDAFT